MTNQRVLIFAGTTEGRKLAQTLVQNGLFCTVCVATEYGVQVMKEHPNIELLQGRLDAEAMCGLMERETFAAVVDATHPFAVEVSQNIRESAERTDTPHFRLKRNTLTADTSQSGEQRFRDSVSCADFLGQTQGNVLLTTGSKELELYCREKSLQDRLYVRVLPGRESIDICQRLKIPGSRILAMQGPFSEELNYALIKQFQIQWLVTKESGANGGYEEKIKAASRAGIGICVIGSPETSEGLSFGQVCEELSALLGERILVRRELDIALVGIGMGSREGLTVEAARVCARAEHVFGAGRLLETVQGGHQYPYYRAEDILPCLDKLLEEEPGECVRVAVLFSGDSGFYSGCKIFHEAVQEWALLQEKKGILVKTRIYPGISSVSYLAAAAGHSWQDAAIVSIHGKGGAEVWREELLQAVRSHQKTFVLTSGVHDVRLIGELLEKEQAGNGFQNKISVITGCRLSYPEQEIRERTPRECAELSEEGIYTCLILHAACSGEMSAQVPRVSGNLSGLPDQCFIRGAVPMTKEEVREAVVGKLRLTPDAVVYDIGSGTGSVAVKIALCSPDISVYALEYKEQAVELIKQNAQKFGLKNLTVVQTHAPEGMEELPVPTHAFIGGSDGCLREILETLRKKNPQVRVVVTAVSLETVAELTELLQEEAAADAEVVSIQVSRAKKLGRYHMMQAENPIYIVSF